MKRLIFVFTIIIVLGSSMIIFAQEQSKDITVFIDGISVKFDVNPIIQNERTLVPFRAVAEILNLDVSWDDTTKTVIAQDSKINIKLQIDNNTAYKNNSPIELDVPPIILDNRTLIPLRFFSEAFGCQVEWDGSNRRVDITSPQKEMTVLGYYALGDINTSSWTDLYEESYPKSAVGNTNEISELALGWYSLDEAGTLIIDSNSGWRRPEGWENVLNTANEYKIRTEMLVYLSDGNLTLTNLLNNEVAVNQAVENIVAQANKYKGVNLDFEGLGWSDTGEELELVKGSYVDFVKLLSDKLKANKRTLTLTLHPLNSAYKGYDYQTLGEYANKIIIMAYDYGPNPEPDNSVIEAVEMAKEFVPDNKLMLGISAPSETANSMLTKIGIAKRYELKGIAIWRLGLVSDDMWKIIRTSVSAKKTLY